MGSRSETVIAEGPAAHDYVLPSTLADGGASFGAKKDVLDLGGLAEKVAQLTPRTKADVSPGPGHFFSDIGSIGYKQQRVKNAKHGARVRRARLAMLKARRESPCTWNGEAKPRSRPRHLVP